MFNRIVQRMPGLLKKSSRHVEQPISITDESAASEEIKCETMCKEIEDECSSAPERAVIMDTQTEKLPLTTVDVCEEQSLSVDIEREKKLKSLRNLRIRVFVLHTKLDYEISECLARSLEESGFVVSLSGNKLKELSLNHPKLAIVSQKDYDFIIPVVTEAFKTQMYCKKRNDGNRCENEINYFLYDLAAKKYSGAYCDNYRVKPVCVSYKIAKSVAYDPLLQWCFLWPKEFPDLVETLQNTYLDLLKKKSRTKKRSKAEEVKRNDVGGENKSDLGKITIKQHPYAPPNIPQGSAICLNCVAKPMPLKYQWFKNGKIMRGETSSKLILKKLYPDPVTLDKSFQYYCKVSNKYQQENSMTAIVELAEADDTTLYFAEDKVALLIANDEYKNLSHLQTPFTDADELAKLLQSMDFQIILFRNLTLQEMKAAILAFCDRLKDNSYAFFFFAGHGFEVRGQTYLLPVDCSESCFTEEGVCKEFILEHMQEKRTAVNVLLIDACRKPLSQPWEPPEIVTSMRNNTVYGYATTFLSGAFEFKGKNSFFVKHLKEYICQNIGIQEVLLKVQRAFANEKSVRNRQNPVLECSLKLLRKLCDPLSDPSAIDCLVPWTVEQKETTIELPEIKSTITLATVLKEDLCFNRIIIHALLKIKEVSNLPDIEISTEFVLEHLQVPPVEWRHFKTTKLKTDELITLFKKEIFGIQNMKNSYLKGKVLLSSNGRILKKADFFIKVEKIKNVRFFLNMFDNTS